MFRYRSRPLLLLAALGVLLCLFAGPRAAAQIQSQADSSYTASTRAQTGIDVLAKQKFAPLRGMRVGLITNQTGVDSEGRRTIDLLARAPGVKLVALFSPEHGIAGSADAPVADSIDLATQLPIYSLFGGTRRPTPETLKNLDALVFDIQDAGVRFYTYITTMAYCMEAAAKNHISFFVLDRPNPLGGEVIEGPMLDRGRTSFVAYFPLPLRYAMTMGELAKMFNAENKTGADLHVVPLINWLRSETYSQTGLAWVPPSPNLRTVNAAFLYPGIEILQAGGVSVGRGTDAPFEMLGAPWIHAGQLAAALNGRKIPGVSFAAGEFTPKEDPYKGQLCEGVTINITERSALRSIFMGITIADVLHRLYPEQLQVQKMIALLGSASTIEGLQHGDDPTRIEAGWSGDLEQFRRMRAKYLLYQ